MFSQRFRYVMDENPSAYVIVEGPDGVLPERLYAAYSDEIGVRHVTYIRGDRLPESSSDTPEVALNALQSIDQSLIKIANHLDYPIQVKEG